VRYRLPVDHAAIGRELRVEDEAQHHRDPGPVVEPVVVELAGGFLQLGQIVPGHVGEVVMLDMVAHVEAGMESMPDAEVPTI